MSSSPTGRDLLSPADASSPAGRDLFSAKWRIASVAINAGKGRLTDLNIAEQKLEFALQMIDTMHAEIDRSRENFTAVCEREMHLQEAIESKTALGQQLQQAANKLESENRTLQRQESATIEQLNKNTDRIEQEHIATTSALEEHVRTLEEHLRALEEQLRALEEQLRAQKAGFAEERDQTSSQLQYAQNQHTVINERSQRAEAQVSELQPLVTELESLREQHRQKDQALHAAKHEFASRTTMLQSECQKLVSEARSECALKCQNSDIDLVTCTGIVEVQLNVFETSIAQLWEVMQSAESSMQEAAETLKKRAAQCQGTLDFILVENAESLSKCEEQKESLMCELRNKESMTCINEAIIAALQNSGFQLSEALRTQKKNMDKIDEQYQDKIDAIQAANALDKSELENAVSIAELKASSITALVTELQSENDRVSPELGKLQTELGTAQLDTAKWEQMAHDFMDQSQALTENTQGLTEDKQGLEEQVLALQVQSNGFQTRLHEMNNKCEQQKEVLARSNDEQKRLRAELDSAVLESTSAHAKWQHNLRANRKMREDILQLEAKLNGVPAPAEETGNEEDEEEIPDPIVCGQCGKRYSFGKEHVDLEKNCRYHPNAIPTSEGLCENCGWTYLYPCCNGCSKCSTGCSLGSHFPRKRMTLKRAIRKVCLLRAFSELECKHCDKRYISNMNHTHMCAYHRKGATKVFDAVSCKHCNEKTTMVFECCQMCPKCAQNKDGCVRDSHVPKFIFMLTSSGKRIKTPNY